ncbi:tail fiber domain-containing protein [Flavobacteriales bacterium]|nr:tail fiber domain-containing protein [Flavobacteriales bacterium]
MKNLLFSLLLIFSYAFITGTSLAQTVPQEMNYQGVARDAAGNVLANQPIGLQIDLRQTTSTGTVVYGESHAVTTNQFGLFNIKIGSGSVVLGTISGIDWSSGPYYVEVGMDAAGGTTYVSLGVSQLLSVPYALYAETSGSAGPTGPQGSAGADGAQGPTGPTGPLVTGIENQTLRHNGSDWEASSILLNDGTGHIGIGGLESALGLRGRLHVFASGTGINDGIKMTSSQGNDEDWYYYLNADDDLVIRDDADDIMTFENSTRQVGIGTTTPSAALEVVGDTLVTGMFSSDYTGGFLQQPKVLYGEYNGESLSGAAVYGKSVLANDGDGIGSVGEGGYIGVQGILDAGNTTEDVYAGYFAPRQGFTGPLSQAGGGGTSNRWGVYAESADGLINYGVQGLAVDSDADVNYGVQATASDALNNYGVQAIATDGLGNYGLWASASGGIGNYAGYFEQGTVYVGDNVGIGTTNPQTELHIEHSPLSDGGLTLENTSTNNAWSFYVSLSSNQLRLYYNGSVTGGFDEVSGNYTALSDKNLKRNISSMESGVLLKIMQMRPATYQYKSDSEGKQYLGFIAQELKEIFPSVVTVLEEDGANEEGLHVVSYSEIIPVLTKGIQEQQQLIKTQKAQISALELKVDELDTLKAEIEKIKSALGASNNR